MRAFHANRKIVTFFVVVTYSLAQPNVNTFIRSSRIQRRRSFSESVGTRIIVLKASQVSSCSKRSREITTEPIAVLTKKWQSMLVRGVATCTQIRNCVPENNNKNK